MKNKHGSALNFYNRRFPMRPPNLKRLPVCLLAFAAGALLIYFVRPSFTQPGAKEGQKPEIGKTSYDQIAPVLIGQQTFADMVAKDKAAKDEIMDRQKKLLDERYDLTKKVHAKVKMTRGKPIPKGPTAKLPEGMT